MTERKLPQSLREINDYFEAEIDRLARDIEAKKETEKRERVTRKACAKNHKNIT